MQTFVLPISQKGRLIEAVGFLGPGWTWQGKQLGRAEWKLVESGHDLETREKQLLGTGAGEPGSSHRKPSEDLTLTYLSPVVSWIDVYARATCQPREVVVPLTMELMGTVAKQLVPSCVTVQRCGGCCPDDGLECVPTGQHQVRMQILMIRYPSSQLGEMSLEEHSQCECRCQPGSAFGFAGSTLGECWV
uniref:Vascular endothelial growth factor B n=1 Tax=Sus scrofa TaxID=9823 RepID=A0A480ZNB1_PIG